MPSVNPLFDSFYRRLTWSNSRQSWGERIGALGFLVGAVSAYLFGRNLPRAQQVVLWGLLLAGLIVVLRRGWLKLFGPVLFYDLVRLARRGRYALVRSLYALFLLFMLASVYHSSSQANQWSLGGNLKASELATLAESFFSTFMIIQFIAVATLTPAYVGGAVSEEKERKTLEFILATDLRNREIVLSKLASRIANLSLLILAGLPILSFTQFMGGVDPDLVLAGFAATGLMMLGLSGLSILCSVYSRKARTGIVQTYALMLIYFLAFGFLSALLSGYPMVAGFRILPWSGAWTLRDLVDGMNAGNPIVLLYELGQALSNGLPLAEVIPGLLRNYALFHLTLTAVCTIWATLRLRAVFLVETYGGGQRRKLNLAVRRRRRRPPVGNQPILWKEAFADRGLQLNWFGRIILAVLVLASFAPVVWMEVYYFINNTARDHVSWETNAYVRVVGTLVAGLSLLGIALRASSSVSGERDRQTWDSILTTPLDSNSILVGKWLGIILSARWSALWLAMIWLMGVITGGLSVLAVPLLAAACAVYAGFLSCMGLWFSTVSRTTMRANVGTLATSLFLAGGYWLFCVSCCFPMIRLGPSGQGITDIVEFQSVGLTPPVTLGFLAFTNDERQSTLGIESRFVTFAIVGVLCWAVMTAIMWGLTSNRFREATGRVIKPRRLAPAEAVSAPIAADES